MEQRGNYILPYKEGIACRQGLRESGAVVSVSNTQQKEAGNTPLCFFFRFHEIKERHIQNLEFNFKEFFHIKQNGNKITISKPLLIHCVNKRRRGNTSFWYYRVFKPQE
jgi:hypothetical protein